ncbi:RNA-directed DNA polymerase, eukaryota, reverse transcriptase zinc-binding domain protein [Tanacetum coccineum]
MSTSRHNEKRQLCGSCDDNKVSEEVVMDDECNDNCVDNVSDVSGSNENQEHVEENNGSVDEALEKSKDGFNKKQSNNENHHANNGSTNASYVSMAKSYQSMWELTACGYFVGYKMYIQELKYHLFRRYGLKRITSIGNGNYVFKFNNESGLQTVIENGVWIVNNKPMIVQRWDIDVDINKVEPDVLPIWVKLVNLPLEAWTAKGLSAITSRLGKPVIMDSVTTQMCNQGIGRLGYARVLIEVEAKKGLPETIDIQYFDKDNKVSNTKTVKVMYDWKPPMCTKCKVFGHMEEKCGQDSGKGGVDNKANIKEKGGLNYE